MKAATMIGIVEQDSIVKMGPVRILRAAKKRLQSASLKGSVPTAVEVAPSAFPVQPGAYLATKRFSEEVLRQTYRRE